MSEKITSAMVLAAGMGSRLRPLTDDLPKPLIKVGGEPVILRTLDLLAGAGIGRVVINTHYLAEQLQKAVKGRKPAGMEVYFSHEEELLETGGGVKKALPQLGTEPFLVVNSDAVWLEHETPLLEPLMQAFDPARHDALLATVPTRWAEEFQPLGDFKLERDSGVLNREPPRSKWDVIYAGVHVTHPDFIAGETEIGFGLMKLWEEAMREGRLHGHCYDAPWADMGTHSGLLRARRMVDPTQGD